MKGVVIGGTSSGVGKTVATLAVLRALETAGYDPQPAKAGPDFIDPSHHAAVVEGHSRSLDPWLEGDVGTRRTYYRGDGDLCVVEGMMGLYDGSVCSTARVAEVLDLPVVLVVDASAGMESVAATALGFRKYAAEVGIDIDVVGIIAQRAHGGRHEAGVRDALPEGIGFVGRIPPTDGLAVPDRHLGLELGTESPVESDALNRAAAEIDTELIADIARTPPRPTAASQLTSTEPDSRPRVAVAADAAHCFCYPSTRERLREIADVVTFSPVAGDPVPDCDGVYLPGGYPELHADALTESPTLDTLSRRAAEGLPIFGECGGLMTLAESLTTTDGERVEMAGVLPADVRMHERYQALDHVELWADEGTLTADAGSSLHGHEFHYSAARTGSDARFAFSVERGDGITGRRDGLTEHRTLGTYAHVHPESGAFDSFVDRL